MTDTRIYQPKEPPWKAAPEGISREEWRRFKKALAKKMKQARCRGYSP